MLQMRNLGFMEVKGYVKGENIKSKIKDSNPGLPDPTLSSLFPVALREAAP